MKWHCLSCWKDFHEDELNRVDEGIGAYEYWGSRGVDHHWVAVCPDCGEYVEEGSLPGCEECGEEITQKQFDSGKLCEACTKLKEIEEAKENTPEAPCQI